MLIRILVLCMGMATTSDATCSQKIPLALWKQFFFKVKLVLMMGFVVIKPVSSETIIGSVYNIGTGEELSNLEIAEHISVVLNVNDHAVRDLNHCRWFYYQLIIKTEFDRVCSRSSKQ